MHNCSSSITLRRDQIYMTISTDGLLRPDHRRASFLLVYLGNVILPQFLHVFGLVVGLNRSSYFLYLRPLNQNRTRL